MSESRAVPSGKVYRQLFDAQVGQKSQQDVGMTRLIVGGNLSLNPSGFIHNDSKIEYIVNLIFGKFHTHKRRMRKTTHSFHTLG